LANFLFCSQIDSIHRAEALIKMATPIASTPLRWPLSFPSETVASDHVSAACYRRTEDIDVLPVVMPELKFRDVQRQILATDLVIGADHAALKYAPKAFNRVGMNGTYNVVTAAFADMDKSIRQVRDHRPPTRGYRIHTSDSIFSISLTKNVSHQSHFLQL
jgi:hypothetical protein